MVLILAAGPLFLLDRCGGCKVQRETKQDTRLNVKGMDVDIEKKKKRPSRSKFIVEAKREGRAGLCIM